MVGIRGVFAKRRLTSGLMILAIALLAFLSYREILGYYFTAGDSFALIDTARLESYKDLLRIFSEPLMSGTEFLARYYRPIATLSFSADYLIWKLNPLGYHLTDVLLHIASSVLVFLIIRRLKRDDQLAAWLGAMIFTAHPILVETVPAIARRQDMLAALFILLSVLFFLLHRGSESRCWKYLLASLFFYALALGSKETTVILPLFVLAYFVIYSRVDRQWSLSHQAKGAKAGRILLLYLAMTLAYLFWRTRVLHGIGGMTPLSLTSLRSLMEVLHSDIVYSYFMALLDPYELIGAPAIGWLITIISVLVVFWMYKRAVSVILRLRDGRLMKAVTCSLATALFLSSVAFFAYVLMRSLTDGGIQSTYYAAFFTAMCLIAIVQPERISRSLATPGSGQLMAFMLIWLLLPLALYLWTRSFSVHGMYIPAIAFSAALAVLLLESSRAVVHRIRENRSASPSCRPILISTKVSSAGIFLVVAGLTLSLFRYSPLVEAYQEWEKSGMVADMFLKRLEEIMPQLPQDATISVWGFPRTISHLFEEPQPKSVTHLCKYSLKSWLNLHYPGNRMKVMMSKKPFGFLPRDFRLAMRLRGDTALIEVKAIP